MSDNKVPVKLRRRPTMVQMMPYSQDEYGPGPFVPDDHAERTDKKPTVVLGDAWDLFHAYFEIHKLANELGDSAVLLLAAVALRHTFEYLAHDEVFIELARQADLIREGKPDVLNWLQKKCPDYIELNRVANATKHFKLVRKDTPVVERVAMREEETREHYESIYEMAHGIEQDVSTIMEFSDGKRADVDEILYVTRMFLFDLIKEHRPERFAERPLLTVNDPE